VKQVFALCVEGHRVTAIWILPYSCLMCIILATRLLKPIGTSV